MTKRVLSLLRDYINPVKTKFTDIYLNNIFGGNESRSGEGSSLVQTEILRKELPQLLHEFNVKVLLDAPCGDFFWMRESELAVEKYIGVDIVSELIESNNKLYSNQQRVFLMRDIIEQELPKSDFILCRDCLVHLSFKQGIKTIKNFKRSGSKYFASTTFTDRRQNDDLGKGIWRTLNLQIEPFNFPKPLKIINENCTEGDGKFSDKSLGLWLLDDIVL